MHQRVRAFADVVDVARADRPPHTLLAHRDDPVAAHAARYLLDLDARRLRRIPRTTVAADAGGTPAPAGTVVFLFDVDGAWIELVELEHCAVGAEMRLRAVIDGQPQPWRTTTVLHINRVPG